MTGRLLVPATLRETTHLATFSLILFNELQFTISADKSQLQNKSGIFQPADADAELHMSTPKTNKQTYNHNLKSLYEGTCQGKNTTK